MKLPGWLAAIVSDVVALRTHWSGVRGGWRAARRDAEELVKYRRLLVDTSAMTPDSRPITAMCPPSRHATMDCAKVAGPPTSMT